MDFSQNKPIRELINTKPDNSDVTVEDIYAILCGDMTPQDIFDRRRAKAEKKAYERNLAARVAFYSDPDKHPTKSLLRLFRKMGGSWQGNGWDYAYRKPQGFVNGDIEQEAIRRVLKTREHVPTDKAEGKAARRQKASQHHGSRKLAHDIKKKFARPLAPFEELKELRKFDEEHGKTPRQFGSRRKAKRAVCAHPWR